ncbi:two-component sensor histidine kinase [Acrocarpospora phusangensis]|uniref:histidine kinase n=1 Tax=Acrocarpospora phusangensis TaxID=1070424 RepID=A0A919Q9E7_9ACTN|nr:two-component sensor histidine kinase [Acrocarpospora phusangensis]
MRSWVRSLPLIGDSALAIALTVASTVFILIADAEALAQWQGSAQIPLRDPNVGSVLLAGLMTLSVALRRRWPFVLLVALAVPQFALDLFHFNTGFSGVATLILLYTVAARRGLALSVVGAVFSMIGYLLSVLLTYDRPSWPDHVVAVAVMTLCWVIGRSVRLRRAYLDELVDRADRLERAREADTRAARAEERSRIARELHDVVAHHVSVMTVQAAAARKMLDKDRQVAEDALQAIEQMGRTAMAEMRDIVGVLRTDGPAERGPQPGMQDLPSLIEQMREAGLRTQLWLEGEQRTLPPGIDLAAYRLVQEALTNSLRHAGPAARAWVTVRQEPSELTVHVEDDGRGSDRPGRGPGTVPERAPGTGQGKGHGLVGIKERVALYGGVLRIGPRQGGGFEVRAMFPLKDRH